MNTESLSPQGELRRRQILQLAQGEARRRRRRRDVGRGGIAGAAVLIALAVILPRYRQPHLPTPLSPIAKANPPVAEPSVVVTFIQSDPTITDRLTLKPEPARWTNISDRELLDEMAAAGQPAGIVCMNGKTMLLSR